MIPLFRFLVTVLLLVVGTQHVAARELSAEEASARFASAAEAHRREMTYMWSMRNAPPKFFSEPSIEGTARIIGQTLHNRGLIIFYSQGKAELTVFAINSEGLIGAEALPIGSNALREQVSQLRRSLGIEAEAAVRAPRFRGVGRGTPPPATSPLEEAADRLSRTLLPKLVREAMAKHTFVWLVVDGTLATVPFGMLPVGDGRMVVDLATTVIAPSLFDIEVPSDWHLGNIITDEAASSERQNRYVIVGDPVVPKSKRWSVPPLDAAKAEALMVSRVTGGTALVREAATKRDIVQRLGTAPLIHVAAHGVADPKDPLDGGFLMLAGTSEADALLTAREIQSLKLHAGLVVLSACQSGLGYEHRGGMVGLARAFQIAGAHRVVMSLWNVSDEATLFLMDRFYHHLRYTKYAPGYRAGFGQDISPASALRLAMVDTRDFYPHPKYWSAFSMFGPPR